MSFHIAPLGPGREPGEQKRASDISAKVRQNEPATARERVDPVTGLHWDFERVSMVLRDRVASGAVSVNGPLPRGTSLVFPEKDRLPEKSRRPLELFAEYLGKPGSVVQRRGARDDDLVVLPTDPTRLTDQNAGLFYESAAKTLGDAFGSPRPRPVAGPASLLEVLRDIGAYLIDRACKDVRYGISWRSALDRAGVDPFGFLAGPVADRIVAGTVGPGAQCSEERWDLNTAGSLLSVIVDAIGEGAVEDFAEDLRARCSLSDCGAPHGMFEAVDGRLIVAVLGLARFGHVNPHDSESLTEFFGTDSDKLAHQLRAWCWLWAGSEGDSERPVQKRLADKVLREIGWVREWHGRAQGDALLDALRKEPNAFPRGLAVSSPEPAATALAPSWTAPTDAENPSASSAEGNGSSGALAPADGLGPGRFQTSPSGRALPLSAHHRGGARNVGCRKDAPSSTPSSIT